MGAFETIPFNKLTLADSNIRKSTPDPQRDAELRASIEAQGVLQNLIVSKAGRGKAQVQAGKRRYQAVAALVAENKLPKTYPVPCYVLGKDENSEQAALIENTLRVDMHPVDEYESFSRLHFEHNYPVEKIAAQFGRSTLDVEKRLRLGNVAPELRALCRAGEFSVDVLAAFSGVDDHARQMQCYEAMKADNYAIQPHTIRRYLAEGSYTSSSPRVKAISETEYLARGGRISTDLFQEVRYLHDCDIVDELVKTYLTEAAEQLAGQGWRWIDVDMNYLTSGSVSAHPRILDPEPAPQWRIPSALADKQAELKKQVRALEERIDNSEVDELDDDTLERLEDELHEKEQELYNIGEKIEGLAEFSDEQKAVSGCVVTLNHQGITVLRGRVKKEDLPLLKRLEQGDDDDSDEEQPADTEPEAETFSQALRGDLLRWRLIGLRLDLYYNLDIAFRLVQFAVAWEVLRNADMGSGGGYLAPGPLALSIPRIDLSTSVHDDRAEAAKRELDAARRHLPLDWRHPDDVVGSYAGFMQLTHGDRGKIMAWCAGQLLGSFNSDVLEALAEDCGTNLAKYWRPTSENYFKRAPRDVVLKDGVQIFNDENFAHSHRAKSRADLAEILANKIEQMDLADCWLPELMR